jgi:hypothetical protein
MFEAWQNLPENTSRQVFDRILIVLQLMLRRGEGVMVQQLWLLLCRRVLSQSADPNGNKTSNPIQMFHMI